MSLAGPEPDPVTGLSGEGWESVDLGWNVTERLTQDSQTKTMPVSLAGWSAPSPGPELLPFPPGCSVSATYGGGSHPNGISTLSP